jgi:TonB family protein
MNRIQKKCLVGSAILHGVLALVLIFGAAFVSHEPAAPPALQVVPDIDHITDDATHGGDRTAQPPPPAPVPQPPELPPPTPPVQVQQPPPPKPEPVKEVVKPEPPKVARIDPTVTEPKPNKKPQISTNLVRSAKPPTTLAANKAAADAAAKKRADAKRRAAIAAAISGINNGVSSSTKVNIDPGPDIGGALSANYRDLVGSIYTQTWDPPSNPASDSAIVKASVTIASDGRVISARITEPSGDAEVDASVKRTLDQVTFIAPFPKGSTDKERSYPIKFDLKAKRLT